jgi:hypothetical protein
MSFALGLGNFTSNRRFPTVSQPTCRPPLLLTAQQENFYEPMPSDPWCKFNADFTYSSSLFVRQVSHTSKTALPAHTMAGRRHAHYALAVPQRGRRQRSVPRAGAQFACDSHVHFMIYSTCLNSLQVAQYPPLRVSRDPATWVFSLENEYVRF